MLSTLSLMSAADVNVLVLKGSPDKGQFGVLCEFDGESTSGCTIRSPYVDTAVHNWSCIAFWLETPAYTNVILTARLLQLNSTLVVC
jgi:hypothetical protein